MAARRFLTLLAPGALILVTFAGASCWRSNPGGPRTSRRDLRGEVNAHIDEGAGLYRRKDYARARDAFDLALRLDPENAAAYFNRGLAWKALKEYDRAVADFDEALRLNPRDAEAWNNRGLAWFHRQDYVRALHDFDEAIRLDPTRSGPFSNRGITRHARQEYRLALKDFDEAIRLDPRYAKAHCNRGLTWKALGDNDRAVADFTAAVGAEAKYLRAYVERALIYEGRKDYGSAVKDYESALAVYAGEIPALERLAWLLATCPRARYRDGRRAVELARKVCERTDWKDPDGLAVLAAASAEAGDFAAACRWQRQALDAPDYAQAHMDSGRSQLRRYEEGKPWRAE
jgi:tetratricopeptide (TPR) repeat protein